MSKTLKAEPISLERADAQLRGTIMMVLATVGFASGSILVKFIYREGISPATMQAVRMVIAATVLWVLFGAVRGWRQYLRLESRRQFWGCLAVAATNSVSQLLYFLALVELDAGLAQMIFACNPVIVIVIMFFFGERPTGPKMARLGLAMLGLYFLILVGNGGAKPANFTSIMMIIGCAFVYAAHIILYQKLLSQTNSFTNTLYILSIMAVIYTILELAQNGLNGVTHVSGLGWGLLIAMALVTAVIARLLMFTGVMLAGSTTIALAGVSEPLLVLVGATLILGEKLNLWQWVGAGLIVASIGLGSLKPSSLARSRIAEPSINEKSA